MALGEKKYNELVTRGELILNQELDMKLIAYIAVVLVALVMGVLWGTWLSLGRSLKTFSQIYSWVLEKL